MSMRRFKLAKGDRMGFDYDAPKDGIVHRVGVVESIKRAKKTDQKLIVITIKDETVGGGFRSFHYNKMRNIRVQSASLV